MSEECSSKITTKPDLTDVLTGGFYILTKKYLSECSNSSCDSFLAIRNILSNIENGLLTPAELECEVRFMQDWLWFRLELIEDLDLGSEEKLSILRKIAKKNEMLREIANTIKQEEFKYLLKPKGEHHSPEMTQNSTHIGDDKSLIKCYESERATTNHSNTKNCVDINAILSNSDQLLNEAELQVPCHGDEIPPDLSLNNNTDETECDLKEHHNSMMDLKNGLVSPNLKAKFRNSVLNIKHEQQRSRMKRLRHTVIKNGEILFTNEHYVTAQSLGKDVVRGTANESDSDVETPTWKVVNYTGCYSIESTEHLDDEIFKKRHGKYEQDEQRRKRWDVQRIRELKHSDNLRLRQERSSSSSANEKFTPIASIWSTPEDLKSVEVCDKFPVTAFGAPIPRITPSYFSLPWLKEEDMEVKPGPQENPMNLSAQLQTVPGLKIKRPSSSKPRKRRRGARKHY